MKRAEKEVDVLKSQISKKYAHMSSDILNMSDEGRYTNIKTSKNMSTPLSIHNETLD
jgi:hypothetical protein